MKTFAIFPTLCILIISFAVIKDQLTVKRSLLWSFAVTVVLGGLLLLFSAELLVLLYLSNFVLAIVLVPVLTFLLDGFFQS